MSRIAPEQLPLPRRRRRRSRLSRWLRGTLKVGGIVLVVAVLALAGVLGWVIRTERGTRWAAEQALAFYNGRMPGSIATDGIDGAVGERLCVRGLRLADARGRALVSVGSACLNLDLGALLRRTLETSSLVAEKIDVHLWPDPSWTDLTPTATLVAGQNDDLPGPDLGIGIAASVTASGFTLLEHAPDGTVRALVSDAALLGRVQGRGRDAEADVRHFAGAVPIAQLAISGGHARVHWTSPTVTVDALSAVTSLGVVQDLHGQLETTTMRYDLGLSAVALGALPQGGTLPPIRLRAEGTGWGGSALLHARARAWGYGSVDSQVHTSAAGGLVATTIATVVPDPALAQQPVNVLANVRIARDHLSGNAVLVAHDSVVVGRLREHRARIEASLPGARAQAWATLPGATPLTVRGHADVESSEAALTELAEILGRPLPQVALDAEVTAACRKPNAWDCHVDGVVSRQGDRVTATADLRVDRGVRIALSALHGQVRDETIALRSPALIAVDASGVRVQGLDLAVARGSIRVDGRATRANDSDLSLVASRLDLGIVSHFVPALALRGRLDANARMRGSLQDPRVQARVDVAALRWAEQALGSLHAEASLDGDDGHARLSLRDGTTALVVVADGPLRLGDGGPPVRPRDRVCVTVDLDAFALPRLNPWWPQLKLDGTVDLAARLDGSLARPVLTATARARGLSHDGQPLGDFTLQADYSKARATALLQGTEHGATLRAEASVPLQLRLDRGAVKLDPDQAHHGHLTVTGFQLARLDPWLPKRDLQGIVDGEITVASVDGQVSGEASLSGRSLALDTHEIGAASIDVAIGDQDTRVGVLVSGTRARMIELRARGPLSFSGPLDPPSWRPEGPMDVVLQLRDVDLAALGQWTQTATMSGRIDGVTRLEGSPRRPRVTADLTVDALAAFGGKLGHAELRSTYDGRVLVADLHQRKGLQRTELSAQVPLTLDFAAPSVRWHRDAEHTVTLHAEALDRETVAVFAQVPEDLDFQGALDLRAHGTVDDPNAALRVRATVQTPGYPSTPVMLQANLTPKAQDLRAIIGSGGPKGLLVTAHSESAMAALLAGNFDPAAVAITATADADAFPLHELAPLLPSAIHDPRGALQLHATMDGTVFAPHLSGSLTLRGGALTVVPLNQRFDAVEIDATLAGPDLRLERFVAVSGEGTLSASGGLHLAPRESRAQGKITAHKLPIVRPGLPMMRVDARVDVVVDATGRQTKIDLQAHDGFVDVLELTPVEAAKSLPTQDGVTYTDRQGIRTAKRDAREGRTPWMPRDLALTVALADPLRIRGPQADMEWTGKVHVVRDQGSQATATGSFEARDDGFVGLLGNSFRIVQGEVRMPQDGDLDPYIDLVATTEIDGTEVTMTLRDRISRPELILRSEPSLPESDIFALLITGQSDASQADEGEFSAKAASVLAAFQSSALQGYLRKQVGIDRIGIGFGDTADQPIVAVGKRINRKLYVEAEYHHNAPEDANTAEVSLEYFFSPPHWSVETFFGDAARGGVALWWRHRFGVLRTRPRDTPSGTPSDTPRERSNAAAHPPRTL